MSRVTPGSLEKDAYDRATAAAASLAPFPEGERTSARDAVLDALPVQALDARESMRFLPAADSTRRSPAASDGSQAQAYASFGADASFESVRRDVVAAGRARLRRNTKMATGWLWRGLLWAIVWVGVGLFVMALNLSDNAVTRHISAKEAERVALRLAMGAVIGHVIAGALRSVALVASGTAVAAVIDAAEWLALQTLASTVGTLLIIPASNISLNDHHTRHLNITRPLRRRLAKYLTTLVIASILWIVQELVALNTIKLWTRRRFAERLDRAAGMFGVVQRLVDVAANEINARGGRALRPFTTALRRVPFDSRLQSLKVAMYFGMEFGSVASRGDAHDLGARLFSLVRGAARRRGAAAGPEVGRDDVRELVVEPAGDEGAFFDELFPPAVAALGESEFSAAVGNVFVERRFLAATISGSGSLTGVVKKIFQFAWLFLTGIATLLVWNGSLLNAAVLIGSILLGLSWAIGAPTARFLGGVAFVLLADPFDIGDRCFVLEPSAATTGDGNVKGYPIIVKEMGSAYTIFMSSFNEQVVIPNHVLADKAVFNHSRSPVPCLNVNLCLSSRTHPDKIAAFAAALAEYVRTHPAAWSEVYVFFSGLDQAAGAMNLSCWFVSASQGGYHDWNALYADRSRVYQFVQAYVYESRLHFVHPTQPLLSFPDNENAGVFGSDVSR